MKKVSILSLLFLTLAVVLVNTTVAQAFDFEGTYQTTNRDETITIKKVDGNQYKVESSSGWYNVSLLDDSQKVLWGVYREPNGVCGYHHMEHMGQNVVKIQTVSKIGAKPHEWFITKK